ncbi:effector-binding domain-containing protein [Halobacillus karajensis]|uniref:MerR family transcriptional regulator n=1 Tax=Halobacillus karajensis TaxID=195088 RepID=UPI0008A745BE|nr:MerR family transcriptional regulator [Halobacillus karajensis]SEH98359.1 effector-binding domain-containing protein [Halobacillus karajensis]
MHGRFTIGEISKLHKIPVKTLRYYDEIDLFKPYEVDERTGYRYYSTEQFEHLNIIHYLRELGTPLKEIKSVFEERDVDLFYRLLKKQEESAIQQIKELEKVRQRAKNRMEELKWARKKKDSTEPVLQFLPERHVLELKEPIHSYAELELALRKLENLTDRKASIFIGGVGVTLPKKAIHSKRYKAYESIFLMDEEKRDSPYSNVLPAMTYACLYCNEARIETPEYYERLMNYIEDQGYQQAGAAIERVIIDHYVSKHKDEHLCEIQVPVIPI